MAELAGRVALVTGAARGIGRATALALAEAGARVVVSDVSEPLADLDYETGAAAGLEETARLIASRGGEALVAFADIRRIDELGAAVAGGLERFARLDILVANAGIASWPRTTWQASEAEWQTMIDVTLTGTWNTCRVAIPAILDGGRGGASVIVSSTAALKPLPTIGHYAAAKAGLVGLMKSLALELASARIRVNTVHPGGTATDMTENAAAERWQATAPGVAGALELPMPIHRMEPRDIAYAIRWLCSDEARYVTGTTSVVDAGALLR